MHSRQLEYFKQVADLGSLSQAALGLGITQPALSKHIRDLETELHVRLFHRTGRGVSLTRDGERLHTHAIEILGRITLAKSQALESGNSPADSITIGITPTIARMAIVPLTKSLLAHSPNMAIRFIEGFSVNLLEWLGSGKLDFALLYGSGVTNRLHAEHLLSEQLHLIAPAANRQLPAEISFSILARESLVLPGAPYGLRPLIDDAADRAGIILKASVEVDGFGSLIDMVLSGVGMTILPAAVVQREIEAGQLRAIAIRDPEICRTMVIAGATNRTYIRGLSSVVSIVKREFLALAENPPRQKKLMTALAG